MGKDHGSPACTFQTHSAALDTSFPLACLVVDVSTLLLLALGVVEVAAAWWVEKGRVGSEGCALVVEGGL